MVQPELCRRNTAAVVSMAVTILTAASLSGQTMDRPDLDALYRVRDQGFKHSKVMEIESYLTEVYGPRLTGSPNFKLAADYAQRQLKEFGLVNVHAERFRFGRGWANERFYAHAVSPQPYPLIGFAKAWTPGTPGWVSGNAVDVSDIQSDADFAKHAGKLKGKFVLTEPIRDLTPPFEPFAHRLTDAELAEMTKLRSPIHHRNPVDVERARKRNYLEPKKAEFFIKEGVLATVEPGLGYPPPMPTTDGGTVEQSLEPRAGSPKPNAAPLPAAVVIAVEHYNQMMRTLEKNIPVTLEMNVQNKFYDDDPDSFNVLGEILGAEKPDEVVMLGAHLDSWHMGTGATDNGSGVASMLEAVRILKAAGLKMRRTVRIGLWSGEEQGMLGSRAYVKEHFYDPETGKVKPEHAKLAAYFNSDDGAGAIRAINCSYEAVVPIFESWMEPLHEMGMRTVTIGDALGTDHASFNFSGLPSFMFIQDPLDYITRTHHTNMDVYDRVPPFDLMGNAVKIAFFVYQTANRDELLPRKPMLQLQPAAPQVAAAAAPESALKIFEEKLDRDIAARVDPFVTRPSPIVGAAVGLIHEGKLVWSQGFGYADHDQKITVVPETVFQVGSVSKSVAAWGVMRLVEEGKIDLDAPANRYLTRWHLPPSQFDNQKVTVRRLLSHTASLTLEGYQGVDPKQPLPTLEQSLSGENGDTGRGLRGSKRGAVEVVAEPGSTWSYSGGGYTLLQLIVEERTHESFAGYMQHAVLQPLGMQHSSYDWLPDIQPLTAKPYDKSGQVLPNYHFTELAAAGLYSTVPDMAKFVIASMTETGDSGEKFHTGGGVLKPRTVELIETAAPGTDKAWDGGWGLGPEVEDLPNGIRMVGHTGSNAGWKAEWWAMPQRGEGLVVLSNSEAARYILQPVKCEWAIWASGTVPKECTRYVTQQSVK